MASEKVIAIIKSSNSRSKAKVLDYQYDKEKDIMKITFIYNSRKKITTEIHDEVNDIVKVIGRRYFIVDDDIFFIDDASNVKGAL